MTATATPVLKPTAAAELALELGTPDQRERYLAGVLPEDEILALARGVLFAPLDGFPRYSSSRKIKAAEVKHRHDCGLLERCRDCAREVDFETCFATELDAGEWATYKKIALAASLAGEHAWVDAGAVSVEPLTHWASCPACGAEVCRSTVKVSIHWAGRTLVREYALLASPPPVTTPDKEL